MISLHHQQIVSCLLHHEQQCWSSYSYGCYGL